MGHDEDDAEDRARREMFREISAREAGNSEQREKWRGNYVSAPHFFSLNHACTLINRAFDGFGCYLVGSAIDRRDHRDVDVRFIMADDAYLNLFRDDRGWQNARWSLMCTSISLWLSQQTGLQIDFQIQQQTAANRDHGGKARWALGVFLDYPGEVPSEGKGA